MKKISLTSIFVFLVSFAFSQFNPYIPVGKTINSFSEKQYQYSLETIDSHHQVPHPVLNIIFFDDFGTDKGWTGYEEDYWERGITLADLEYSEWNRSNPDCRMPENDFSSSADSTILGFNIGSCHEIGVVVAEKVITSPVIDCSGKDRVYMSFRSFSCFRASSEFTIQMYNGYTWQTVETTINNVFAYIYSDQRWVYHEADISEFAANNSEFRFRYTYQPHTTDDWFPGISIDDVTLYEPEQSDIGITNISPNFDFGLQDDIIPTVRVQNFGYDIITNFDAVVTIKDANNISVYSETINYAGTLLPSKDSVLVFPLANINSQGAYNISAEIILNNDNITENNSGSEYFFVNGNTFWFDNFSTDKGWSPLFIESSENLLTANSQNEWTYTVEKLQNESFYSTENSMLGWSASVQNPFEDLLAPTTNLQEKGTKWIDPHLERGVAVRCVDLPSVILLPVTTNYDPAVDLTQNGDNILIGDYIGNNSSKTDVYSPEIDCSGKSNVMCNFSLFLSISRIDVINFEVKDNSGSWHQLWYISPYYATSTFNLLDWTSYTVDVSQYADNNSNFQMRFKYIYLATSSDNHFGLSLDNVSLTSRFEHDLSATKVLPAGSVVGDIIFPIINLENTGVQTINSFSAGFIITDADNNIVFESSEDFNQTISKDDIVNTKCSNSWIPESAGMYKIKAFISNTDDVYSINDTTESFIEITEANYLPSHIYSYFATGNLGPKEFHTLAIDLACGNSQYELQKTQFKIWFGFFPSADFVGNKIITFSPYTRQSYSINSIENKIYLISPNGSSYEYCTVRGLNNIGLETGVLGLGYNVLDDKIYYLCPETNDYKLYRQTLGDNELELVMSIPPNYQYSAMAINSQGQIYAVANDPPNNGKLFKINYQQNSIEYIGIIEVPLTFSQSLSFDRQTDILYGTFYEGSQKDPPYRSRVYQIDTISADIYPLSDYFDDNCQMSFSAFSPDVNDYFLTFNVTENGNPVSGATILVNNENLITGGSGSVTTMLKSGVYEYTANSPCGDTISDKLCIFSQNEAIDIDFDCTTSIENPNSNPNPINNISIYPNPADDIVNIEIEIPTKLTIYDNLLKLVFEKDLHNIKNKVSVNSLKTGVYTFKFQNDNGVIYEKVVIR